MAVVYGRKKTIVKKLTGMKMWLSWLILLAIAPGALADDDQSWRARRLERLQRPDGWLTLVGLFWMEKGENRLGSGSDCSFRLEAGPAWLGTFFWDGQQLSWSGPESSAPRPLDPNEPEGKTRLESGSISWYTIRRDGRLGVRVKDSQSPTRLNFRGLDYYTADPAWSVPGRFRPYPRPREMRTESVISGLEEVSQSPGEIEFQRGGQAYSVQVSSEGDGYSLMFGDRSNGHGTYGAGRFLDIAPADAQGKVMLDFNKAYNPPCCWTPYATCPLPTPQNRLDFAVTAGEKFAGHLETWRPSVSRIAL